MQNIGYACLLRWNLTKGVNNLKTPKVELKDIHVTNTNISRHTDCQKCVLVALSINFLHVGQS